MSDLKKHSILKIIAGILFIMTMSVTAFPWWYANHSGRGFDGDGESSISLEDYVIEGAGYFLDSYANTLVFMKKTELSGREGMDYQESALLLDRALKSMEQANNTYIHLKELADGTPYNPGVIDALKRFDYDAFRETNGLDIHDRIFARVMEHLGKGDIRSIYGDIIVDTGNILNLLKRVKEQVDAGLFPSSADVWKLQRTYSDSLRFGQCVARVFEIILAAN